MIRRTALLLVLLAGPATRAADEPEIYRCTQDDGTVAFQQMPCRPATSPRTDARDAAEQPGNVSDIRPTATGADDDPSRASRQPMPVVASPDDARDVAEPPESAPMSDSRADCEKSARDAIDAIDAELKASRNPDNDRARLDELLDLTRQLRQCRQL